MSLKIDVIKEQIVQADNPNLHLDWEIGHVMAEGLYAKRIEIPAGGVALQHSHHYDHISILASGQAYVTVDDSMTLYTGPAEIVIKKGKNHAIEALNDIVWYCIHNEEVALCHC